ncbi:hyaluronate lyase N-terminal domain-containing protein [Paraburkholderia phenoliruptrix]|uniref:hyaluronate lyase N-terminal domain-containing protein n=1 Tax=Paraburkholderia phenoliruptrix TaxID=252970 RepID=UPI00285EC0C3|nr:hypothetical protein [Paraburkholderia phenoliruptrix]MDR6389254.1 hypothetical protein [Paraburkholderia phenoliruptrix]
MSNQLQLRRGTAAQTASFVGAVGEVTVSTDDHVLHLHDATTPGGFPIALGGVVATFAALPANPLGLYLVVADETKSGNPSIYFFNGGHRYWVAMVQDA